MKRPVILILFFAILAVSLSGLYWSQRRQKSSNVSPNAVLDFAADVQRDVTRLPMHFTRLSEEQEIRIGRGLAASYSGLSLKLLPEEEALQKYVQRVGGAVAVHAKRHLDYSFHLIPDHNLINAFSLPGGPVYIGEGMLDLMETEDELASILAHEVEHIDHYHCIERMQIEAKLKNLNLDVIGQLVQIPLSFWQAGYHKDEEFEADREGVRLAVISGYSPYGAVTMFTRLSKLCDEYIIHAKSPGEELSELAVQSLTGYFRSHPLPSERLDQIQRLIAEQNWQDRKTQKNFRVEYQVHNGEYVK